MGSVIRRHVIHVSSTHGQPLGAFSTDLPTRVVRVQDELVTAAASSPPSVSVVIPHYGSAQPALALAEALAEQTYAGQVQIIVVDDGSPIPFPCDTPGVSVVRRAVNGGYGSAVNTGVRTAVGELLLILNSDLEVGDDFIRDLVSTSAPSMPAVTSPRIVDPAGQEAWTGRRFSKVRHQTTEWLIPLARWRRRGHLDDAVGRDSRARGAAHDTTVDFVAGAAMLMQRSVFEAVGGFDERFFMNSEEADLQRRLRLEGIVSVALRHPIAVHEGGESATRHDAEHG